jgi:hypothetical protein
MLIIIGIVSAIMAGCQGIVLDNNSGNEYDQVNTELAYLKVTPNKIEMNINQTQKFEVKAYNFDNRLIVLDTSKIKWTCTYECIACGVVCDVYPMYDSAQTTFKITNPQKNGKFEVWVKY